MTRRKFLVVGSVLTVTAALVLSSVSYADSLSDAKNKQKQLKNTVSETRATITRLTSREDSLKQQITDLQNQLAGLQASINNTQVDIQKRKQQIADLQDQIRSTEKKLQAQYAQLQQRVRIMYEDGNTSYLEVLFSSGSITDMMDRLELLSAVAQQDRQMVNDIQQTKNELDQKQSDLQSQQAEQQRVYQSLLDQQKQQQTKQSQEQQLLSKVHDDKLAAEADLQQENSALADVAATIQSLEAQYGAYTGSATGWTWPVPSCHVISSGYGPRAFDHSFHPGIDIPGSYGATIVAATSGRVLMAGPASGYGNWIVVQSAGGLMEIYGHMTYGSIRVHPGELVSTGEPIAAVGDEGHSTGPHLHFEVATGFSGGYPVSTNPLQYVHP